jgi:hypothetical protein
MLNIVAMILPEGSNPCLKFSTSSTYASKHGYGMPSRLPFRNTSRHDLLRYETRTVESGSCSTSKSQQMPSLITRNRLPGGGSCFRD